MKLRLQNLPPFRALALVLILLPITSPLASAEGSAAGAGVFKAKCVTCHGPDGSGNTPVGKSLQTADLRSPEVQKKSDAELTQSISEGKGNMPAFKGNITDDEIQSVLKYVRTLTAKSDPASKKKPGN